MTRFSNFTNEELDAMESAFCNEGLKSLVFEIRAEREYRKTHKAESYLHMCYLEKKARKESE